LEQNQDFKEVILIKIQDLNISHQRNQFIKYLKNIHLDLEEDKL